jgi:transcriptional regulator with XRE-family HTH domain
MSTTDTSLAADLRAARRRRKMTEAQLARAFGISQEMLSMAETGTKEIPAELVPMIRRFVESSRLPTSEELAARKNRRLA